MSLRDGLARHLRSHFVDLDTDRLAHLGTHRRGKVRELFVGDDEIWMITTDRLSAFDVVLTSIPCKGAILNAIAVAAFEATADICPNHLLEVPHPNVMRVRRADPLPIEVVVRRYVTGSLWRDLEAGRAGVYEVPLPAGIRRDQRLDQPIITPSTKAEVGIHDEPISRRVILEQGMVEEAVLDRAFELALALFARGEALAAERGLILVDTKYEFGLVDGELIVIDEIHTADSSRYWEASEYEARFAAGESQKMLDKENIRQWLIGVGYQGEGTPPEIPDAVRLDLAETYARLHERLLGRPFVPPAEDVRESLYTVLGR
ncbi:MAG: phosphoribosylaminoimidazolesuccinocarboxamide synthase [Deltaproteobacteria bacterium]|nr:phosphoribosylaminoimidazolesuccinocarboxamide synthase [Deltaproteobacteria bacterium]MCB9788410.1 phosphoribosylaminoimidazolesuccinocarboxamide synthase [Deltaproteobacteria bacterium]